MKKNGLNILIGIIMVTVLGICFLPNAKAANIEKEHINYTYSVVTSTIFPLNDVYLSNLFNPKSGPINCARFTNTINLLKKIFNYVRIGGVLLVTVLTVVEYVKAMSASDQSAFKKANTNTIKRVIGVVVLLILPTLILTLLKMLQFDNGTCGVN